MSTSDTFLRATSTSSAAAEEIRTMSKPARPTQLPRILFLTAAAMCTLSPQLMAQTGEAPGAPQSGAITPDASNQDGWLGRWMRTVDEARASQPHYVAPIVTTH